ncbi:hypothetical protein [Leptospira noguchii]|uniref:hypothetical protein n=1 Tax=Leptospira noguchii TaxID=28182 RepID=UPI001FB62114|nr:hypothetical protein [Leptospira noguchii]UOG36315.1 hypothetical protein MAL02_19405 [Leptospira noguchii]
MKFLKPQVGRDQYGLYSQGRVDQAYQETVKRGIDMEKADPSKLLAKWDHYKNSIPGTR